jgi:hypothetical protein
MSEIKDVKRLKLLNWLPGFLSALAILFGFLTLFAGFRILFSISDPGYVVFKPLLIYNTFMGFVYAITGWFIWKKPEKGLLMTKFVASLNLIVWIIIAALFGLSEGWIAVESLHAMTFRTVIWLGMFFILKLAKREHLGPKQIC